MQPPDIGDYSDLAGIELLKKAGIRLTKLDKKDFENKLKNIMAQSKQAMTQKEMKQMNYVG